MTKKNPDHVAALHEELVDAKKAHADALVLVEKAQRDFDASGDRAAYSALADAERFAIEAAAFVGRAERLHALAVEEAQAVARTRLEARRAELLEALSPAAIKAAADSALDAEHEALVAAVAAHDARVELANAFRERWRELMGVESALGIVAEAGVVFDATGRARTARTHTDPGAAILMDVALYEKLDSDAHAASVSAPLRARRLRALAEGIRSAR